jgi:hypothetical protein
MLVHQRNAGGRFRITVLDHFHQPVQHRLERLILSYHFQGFPAVMFQPFVALPFADVPRDSLETRRHAVLELQPQADLDGGPPAAARDQLELQGRRMTASQLRLDSLLHSCQMFRRRQVPDVHAKDLLAAIPREYLSGAVSRSELSQQIYRENGVRGILDQFAVALLVFAQRLLHVLLIGDVPGVGNHSPHPGLFKQIGALDIAPPPRSVVSPKPELRPELAAWLAQQLAEQPARIRDVVRMNRFKNVPSEPLFRREIHRFR